MKVFTFTGPNPEMKTGVSWKVWKIERRGRVVTAWWGPVSVHLRKVVPQGTLHSRRWTSRTEDAAKADESRRIREKEKKGYKKCPRRARIR